MSMDMQEYQQLLQALKDKYAKETVTRNYKQKAVKKEKKTQLKTKVFKPG